MSIRLLDLEDYGTVIRRNAGKIFTTWHDVTSQKNLILSTAQFSLTETLLSGTTKSAQN